jgi:hypothetical protein
VLFWLSVVFDSLKSDRPFRVSVSSPCNCMSSLRKRAAGPQNIQRNQTSAPISALNQFFTLASPLVDFHVRPFATRDLPFFFELDEQTCVELMGDSSHAYNREWIERIVTTASDSTTSSRTQVGNKKTPYSGGVALWWHPVARTAAAAAAAAVAAAAAHMAILTLQLLCCCWNVASSSPGMDLVLANVLDRIRFM